MTGREINLLALCVADKAFEMLNKDELEDFLCLIGQIQCNLLALKRKNPK